mmetsp:Transcript_5968/g.9670  ORF Transcript_5968/g.9670 Transcript_5968/m.9670 type:complete len:801 (-) Transcript_5968:415-2817(-)|eukprot:CAMPEP_0206397082 /NCGR_PEP_ID=MMETSP0294-20121207/23218_1 /ASSEMBLY_ACC=CAM_ASM_000327 /TAXON_ID=39354 /ORGANISM="Heterosigma akashiwo, Strain CCMP2393" /LENGTH=800 /DNA_ID=CAMNT_0053852035 /DNA_START=15 /DNA_END=2417 /DNA_ORIENTATION=-
MGGAASSKRSSYAEEEDRRKSNGAIKLLKERKGSLGLFTQSEKNMMAENKIVQDNSLLFVKEIIFYSMITREGKMYYPKGHPDEGEPYMWITIDHAKISKIERKEAEGGSPTKQSKRGMFAGYPLGVAIEENGDILITVNNTGNNGEPLMRKIVGRALLDTKVPPPPPDPPALTGATTSSLAVGWAVPFEELGLVARMEVHYRAADGGRALNPWKVLCQRNWLMAEKMEYTLEGLRPFQGYHFRVRAKNSVGYGAFSAATAAFRTLPARPDVPGPPIFAQVTHQMIVLLWRQPCDNGSPITSYKLRQKRAGGVWTDLYKGALTTFTFTGLESDTVYMFELRCENAIGKTDYCASVSCKTQATKSNNVNFGDVDALRAGEFWMECWDPETEKVFYFHKITGERTLQCPEELAKHKEENQIAEDPMTEFRKKRYQFLRGLRMSQKQAGGASSGEKIFTLEVRREKVFEDSFKKYSSLSAKDLHRRTKIVFAGEEGIDSGGLTKDWFLLLSRCLSSSALKLFSTLPNGDLELKFVGQASEVSLRRLRFAGKVVAKAIYDRQMVDLPLATVLYKHLLGRPVALEDLAELDPALHKSLTWMQANDITNVMFETFSVLNEETKEDIDLVEGGRGREVTEANKAEYVELMARWRAEFQVAEQLEAFFGGMFSLIPQDAFKVFDIDELELLINGKKEIDADEIRAYTIFQGAFNKDHPVVLWFFQAMAEWEPPDRAKVLKFCTGTDRIPIDGFEPPFNLTEGADMGPEALPRTHTCFNQLVLPNYPSYAKLKEKLLYAAENADGFQLS